MKGLQAGDTMARGLRREACQRSDKEPVGSGHRVVPSKDMREAGRVQGGQRHPRGPWIVPRAVGTGRALQSLRCDFMCSDALKAFQSETIFFGKINMNYQGQVLLQDALPGQGPSNPPHCLTECHSPCRSLCSSRPAGPPSVHCRPHHTCY